MSKSIPKLPVFWFILVFLFCSAIDAQTNANKGIEEQSEFDLTIRFSQLCADFVEVTTRIRPDVPYTGTVSDKDGKIYKFGGMLLPAKDGRHRLVITTVGPGEDSVSTWVPNLELDEVITVGSIGGILRDCVAPRLSIPKVPKKSL